MPSFKLYYKYVWNSMAQITIKFAGPGFRWFLESWTSELLRCPLLCLTYIFYHFRIQKSLVWIYLILLSEISSGGILRWKKFWYDSDSRWLLHLLLILGREPVQNEIFEKRTLVQMKFCILWNRIFCRNVDDGWVGWLNGVCNHTTGCMLA